MPLTRVQRYLKHSSLPQLTVFEACVRLGNFTRAAEELHMAQPTVSTQIRKLTETVGLPLFEQIGKRVHLTEAGQLLHKACLDIFCTVEEMEHHFEDLRGLTAGHLRLAVSTTGKYFTPRLLAAFMQRHKGIEVSLEIHNRRVLIDRLSANLDDLYIFAHPPVDLDVVRQAILPNPMVVFAHADHPLAREKNIPLARIAEEPFLMREVGSGTRMAVEDVFARASLEPKIRMELSANESIKQAILAGLGISIMSRYTLGLDTDHTELVTLDVQGFPLESQWYFVYPVGKQISVAARTFMDFVRAEARERVFEHLIPH
ncbi:MAG: LysR family transcriptional regulator [Proteobacteria bacterium]|nr:LysR family transcriptional regulator [Pseudomonadota bacterium]